MMEINGRTATAEDLRALALSNYGHFTSMRAEGMRVRGLQLHMERLARDARKMFGAELDTSHVRDLVRAFAAKAPSPAIIRVSVYDAAGDLGHPGATGNPDILITTRPAPAGPPPPLRVESVRYSREMPAVKHAGLQGPLAMRREAQQRGYDDALFTDGHARVSEGPTWNIGFFDGSQVIWPKAEVLQGVTLTLLQDVVDGSGMSWAEAPVDVAQVSETWAAFATNAAVGVRPVQAIDGVELLDGSPLIRNLQLQYSRIEPEEL